MSTDHTVTIHVAAEAVTRLVSNNSPALAARLALADFEGEFGRLPPGSCVEVAWRADGSGRPGTRRYDDLDAIRRALPGAEPAPAQPADDSPFLAWWNSETVYAREGRLHKPHQDTAEAAWAAALAWAAEQAEAAGCFCRMDPRAVIIHDPRCPIALAAAIRAGRP